MLKDYKKYVLLAALLVGSVALASEPAVFAKKVEGKVSVSHQKLIQNALQYINVIWSNQHSVSRALTEKYFTPDVTLILNGKTVYTSYEGLEQHFQGEQTQLHGKFLFPLHEVIGTGNKIVAYFDEDIVDTQGKHYPAKTIAIFTLNHGKIQRWEEVAYTEYFCTPNANKAIFSKGQ